MKKIFQIALGILAAIGGFVDIGDLVFNVEAGATLGYQLLWVVVVGVVGIIVYSEMCGRVAAVSKRPVFDAIRERLGFGVGFGALVASQIVNLMTLAAEVGGVALALELLSGLPYRVLIVLGVAALGGRHLGRRRSSGSSGSSATAASHCSCSWSRRSSCTRTGATWPRASCRTSNTSDKLVYAYFAVGLLGAAMTPYEVYFYSSGVVEEGWTPKDLGLNRANAIIGYSLGGTLSLALMIGAAALFLPLGVEPQFIGTVALGAQVPLGTIGLLLALVGILFAVGGAAIDTCFSGAYNVAQFFGWEWGKERRPSGAPRFTLAWIVLLFLALLVIMTGVDPVLVTEYAVIFSVVALPLTYIPILLVANDRAYMGQYVNGRLANAFGLLYLVVILLVSITAIPLMIVTHQGQG